MVPSWGSPVRFPGGGGVWRSRGDWGCRVSSAPGLLRAFTARAVPLLRGGVHLANRCRRALPWHWCSGTAAGAGCGFTRSAQPGTCSATVGCPAGLLSTAGHRRPRPGCPGAALCTHRVRSSLGPGQAPLGHEGGGEGPRTLGQGQVDTCCSRGRAASQEEAGSELAATPGAWGGQATSPAEKAEPAAGLGRASRSGDPAGTGAAASRVPPRGALGRVHKK